MVIGDLAHLRDALASDINQPDRDIINVWFFGQGTEIFKKIKFDGSNLN